MYFEYLKNLEDNFLQKAYEEAIDLLLGDASFDETKCFNKIYDEKEKTIKHRAALFVSDVKRDIEDEIIRRWNCQNNMAEEDDSIKTSKKYKKGYEDGSKDMEATAQIVIDNLVGIIEKIKGTTRPTKLYAIEDIDTGEIIFNAKGGCYMLEYNARMEISKLHNKTGKSYRIVNYTLEE